MLPTVHPPPARALPETALDATPGRALPWAHREAYDAYFARLARRPDTAAALRRLIPHLDADLTGAERLALWQALWACCQRLGAAASHTVARCLDGRFAARLQALQRPWGDPALIEHLARSTQPAAAQAAFVPALLAHHGLNPLARPAEHPPGLVLLAVRAALHRSTPRLPADAIATLQAATLAAAEQDAALVATGLALLFELALHAADEATATATLAELLNHGQAGALRADRVRAWLDGTAFLDDDDPQAAPLLLAPALQREWLQPATWGHAPVLQALHDAVQRPALRGRIETLAGMLTASKGPSPKPTGDGWQALRALDTAWQLVARGGDAVPVLEGLMTRDTLAPVTLSALLAASARWHARQGDREGEVRSLLQARRHHATPALRQWLAARLPGPVPDLGADWRDEVDYWQGLLHHATPCWPRIARFQLARLHTDGCLEPHPPRREQNLPEAHAQWTQLKAEPRYAAQATQALRQPEQTLLRPAWRQQGGTAWLWFDTPGARGVTIVFSCVATHHGFAEVAALRSQVSTRLPGQHLMFVRCPAKDWYTDDTYDQVHELLRTQVQARFATDEVTCWYGSMGGHGALKFALAFGWRAIAFNPQTDLDLWAAFRPTERAQLWGAERHARLADVPLAAWERAPLYLAFGAATPDREALSVVIDRLCRCRHATAVIEKFDDDNHAGLMGRIAGGAVAPVLDRITQRLKALAGAAPAAGARPLDGPEAAAWWQRLDQARALKVELQVRQGRLWWQPSQACGTQALNSMPAC